MNQVMIVDDHPLLRSGLASAMASAGFEVIAEASSKSEALAILNNLTPDFCVIDLNLGDGTGIEVIKTMINIKKEIKYVVLTMNDEQSQLDLARDCGASAYVLKSAPIDELIAVLSGLAAGIKKFKLVGKINHQNKVKDFQLTAKEMQVLQLLGSGATASVMGRQLFLTEATVKTHLAAIYRKLSASNRAQAISIAIKNKLITD